jgi:hypothetical protein
VQEAPPAQGGTHTVTTLPIVMVHNTGGARACALTQSWRGAMAVAVGPFSRSRVGVATIAWVALVGSDGKPRPQAVCAGGCTMCVRVVQVHWAQGQHQYPLCIFSTPHRLQLTLHCVCCQVNRQHVGIHVAAAPAPFVVLLLTATSNHVGPCEADIN